MRKRMNGFAFVQSVGPSHYANRVDEELGCDARFAFILPESEQTNARDNYHRWIRIAKVRRFRRGPVFVVALIVVPVSDHLFLDACSQCLQVATGRFPINEKRADSGSHKMVRATRP